jgi:DNA-binding NtrC family response regulator
MITAFATVETAVEAMKFGADDFICKPFTLTDLQKVILQQLEGQAILPKSSPISLEDVEKRHIGAVLRQNNGNRRKTAEDLGISLRTLYYKIKQYDLE